VPTTGSQLGMVDQYKELEELKKQLEKDYFGRPNPSIVRTSIDSPYVIVDISVVISWRRTIECTKQNETA
jgi:hypothetical protein